MRIETITPVKAVERLQALGMSISPPTLRNGIEQGVYPFGVCIKQESGERTFQVFTRLLEEWIKERASE